ncbi:MAG: hypothetical protein EOO73_29920 [Myxococcales bacterium]|nr:MAG: hypothetical protein EOO73_29920 [Myxococcales bacterium]
MPVLSLRSLRPACFVLGAGLLAYAGCSSSGSTAVAVTHPTLLEVAPAQFLGAVPCAADGPGLKSYVATLYDTNQTADGGASGDEVESELAKETTESAFARLRGETPSDEFELPSSAPAPCTASVGFGNVVPGRRYEVLIEGYEQDVTEVQARALGSHLLVEKSSTTGPSLAAAFRAYCRRAIPVDSTVVIADQCDPFAYTGDLPPRSLRVPLGALLGTFSCGAEDEQLEELRVTLEIGSESYEQVVDCEPQAEVVFEDLPAGVAEVYIEGLSANGDSLAVAGATCDARLVDGARVTARCNRLSSSGTLRVDLAAALAQLGLSCSDKSVSNVQVLLGPTDTRSFPPPACLQSFETGVEAGPKVVTVQATPVGGQPSALNCHAEIEPGKLSLAECEPVTL